MPLLAAQVIQIGAKMLLIQIGITHDGTDETARTVGLQVVQGRCVKIEHVRLFG